MLLLLLAIAPGCVQRYIQITSEPSDVLVHLNDEEVGRTPVMVPFTFYGTYDVRLEREGYEAKWTQAKAKMPWWELPGPDLVAEMIPGAESIVAWHFELEPQAPAEPEEVVERALELREELLEEAAE